MLIMREECRPWSFGLSCIAAGPPPGLMDSRPDRSELHGRPGLGSGGTGGRRQRTSRSRRTESGMRPGTRGDRRPDPDPSPRFLAHPGRSRRAAEPRRTVLRPAREGSSIVPEFSQAATRYRSLDAIGTASRAGMTHTLDAWGPRPGRPEEIDGTSDRHSLSNSMKGLADYLRGTDWSRLVMSTPKNDRSEGIGIKAVKFLNERPADGIDRPTQTN